MKKNFLFVFIGFFITLNVIILFSFRSGNNYKESAVGDIAYSILSLDLFQKTHGGKWVLLDGKPLSKDTELYQFLGQNSRLDILELDTFNNYRLPDARGVFLRGMNLGRDLKTGDSNGDRLIGRYQDDAFQGHKHINSDRIPENWQRESPNTAKQRVNVTGNILNESAGIYDAGFGKPKVSTETRPRNIALYIYLKVSDVQ
jgi:hypothetical protein